MKIDILPARREREKRESGGDLPWFVWPLMPVLIPAFLVATVFVFFRDNLFHKNYCLFVHCTLEQVPAVQHSLKAALELPYAEFQRFERRIPGPILTGSHEALEWLAKRLNQTTVPCRVHRVSKKTARKVPTFLYPLSHDLSVAEAYLDSVERNDRLGEGRKVRAFVRIK